jgi:hypothetical protein
VDFHRDHKISLSTESEFKNLYSWSLREIDEDGKRVGRDQIPWNWNLYFTLADIGLFYSLKTDRYADHVDGNESKIFEKEFIKAKLVPNLLRDERFNDHTTYSMMGTKRRVSEFEVEIHKLKQGSSEQERCRAYGTVSHTIDLDIGDYTTFEDNVVFSIYLHAEKFDHYVRRVSQKAFTGGSLRLGGVKGFYADWSPGISTNSIKILTGYSKDHAVEVPEACPIVPPRLGEGEEFELLLIGETKFLLPPADEFDELVKSETALERPNAPMPHGMTPQFVPVTDAATSHLLKSLRAAAWIIAGLLLLELIFKR